VLAIALSPFDYPVTLFISMLIHSIAGGDRDDVGNADYF